MESYLIKAGCLLAFLQVHILYYRACGQDAPATPPAIIEQQLENLTENGDDAETEDDAYLQQMQYFIKHPVNLNTADESELNELKAFNPLQIRQLLAYRQSLGAFIHIYELQAVPGWDVALIRKIRPYITVESDMSAGTSVRSRFKNGERTFLARASQVLEKSRGYLADSVANFYPGSPQKLLLRYKYQYKNVLQYGVTAEKDAGEQFFRGKQRAGFDFYSAHFFARNIGAVKAIALGDFAVNFGQGLIQWQGLAFKKSADITNIKRQGEILRPYNSAGEINFHRGAAITVKRKSVEATAFLSMRMLDANFVPATINSADFVSSLQTSGYHRTNSEVSDKNVQRQLSLGGNVSYSRNNFHAGINGVYYRFKYPIIKSADLYNKFALTGTGWSNYSIDYGYTYKNVHIFGEAATDKNLHNAFLTGLLIGMDARVDISVVYRKISRAYQSLYTNAFTESTFPANETGFFAGAAIRATDALRIDAYMDIYAFPWLKFRVNAPSGGKDYLLQATYKPNRQTEIYTRYRAENKGINYNSGVPPLTAVFQKPRQNWRTQLSSRISRYVTFRSRVEVLWYDIKGSASETGFLLFTDILYKPLMKKYSGNVRLQYFEIGGYNSRLYAYENDVLYSFSIPVFYDRGYRYYINMNYDISKKLSLWARWAQVIFPDKSSIGSGLDEIASQRKSEIKLQIIAGF